MSSHKGKLKNNKQLIKRIEKQMLNGQAQINGQPPVVTEPKVLTPQEDYIECLNTLNTFIKQFKFPKETMVAPRLEAMISDIRDFVSKRLEVECAAGVIDCGTVCTENVAVAN